MTGHVAAVTLLQSLRSELVPDLEVRDETGYAASGEIETLRGARQTAGVDASESAEACLRVARTVAAVMGRPPEHPPVRFSDDDDATFDERRMGTERKWDESFKEQERRKARMQREIDERIAAGESTRAALRAAIDEARSEFWGSFPCEIAE